MTLAQGCPKCVSPPHSPLQSFGLRLGTSLLVMYLLSYRVSTRPGNLGEIYIRLSWTSSIYRRIEYYSKLKYYLCVHRNGKTSNWELGRQ